MRKFTALILVLSLFLTPAAAFAAGTGGDVPLPEKSLNAKSLNTKELTGHEPLKSLKSEKDYHDPANYPLIQEGNYVDTLVDSYYTNQSIYFDSVADSEYYSDYMKVRLYYQSDYAYAKDRLLTVELYKEDNNYLTYDGSLDFNTYGYDSVYLNTHFPKADFADQPYIYLRLGVRESSSDLYYSDVMTFKVANPYYTSSTRTNADSYAVISNESTDSSNTQPTGTFNLKNMKLSSTKNLKPSAYKVDVNLPFNAAKYKEQSLVKSEKSISPSYSVGDNKYFWVSDLTDDSNYQISARLAYSGTKANVWVNNNEITDADAVKLGQEFDNKIYSSVTSNFGLESDVNKDGKINILTYDIQDGFNGSGGYVAGYFWGGDLYDVSYSNQSEIFYLDTYPTMGYGTSTKDVSAGYETLAHEFQHMVNYNQNVLVEGSSSNMETWLNEGLSMAAEQIYTGHGLQDRVDYYNASNSIANGQSLLYWDNSGDTLSNYSLSYLFVQYLKIQMGQGNKIFKEIINDPSNNYMAIEKAAKKYISPDMTFGKLMTDFRIALLMKQPTGFYGFKGDPFFNSLEAKSYSGSSANLRGGGSVVTTFNSGDGLTIPSDKGSNVTYTTIRMDGLGLDVTPPKAPVVSTVTDQSTTLNGTTEANAAVLVKAGTNVIGSAMADGSGKLSVTIPKQKSGTKLTVTARDNVGNESSTTVTVATSYKTVKVQLNRKDFTTGYYNGNTYVYWKALDTFKIPYTFKGNGIFTIEGRTVQAVTINGALYIAWNQLSPGKVTYQAITGGYNFIYAVPVKVQLNGKDYNQGYFKNGSTYVYWRALDTFKIPYKYTGNGVFSIEGRTVKGEYINGVLYLNWNQLSPGKVTYKAITGGYNFIYAVPLKVQLNGKDFTQGYSKNGYAYVHWSALKTFNIPYTFKGGTTFVIGGRSVTADTINGGLYLRWDLLAPGKITYKVITGGYNFIYTP